MLTRVGPNRYRLPRVGRMRVAGLVYACPELLAGLEGDGSLKQLMAAASLPTVLEPVCGMPDLHQGFGLPIGGVMVTAGPGALISAGAVGMDINCGVRLLRTRREAASVQSGETLRRLLAAIAGRVPAGVGQKSRLPAFQKLFEAAVHEGARALVAEGFGWPQDLLLTEEEGCLAGADLAAVSDTAVRRGREQVGTLGGGNHFIELQEVERVFDLRTAQVFRLFPGQLVVMVHTGSRGFGQQVCVDFSQQMAFAARRYGLDLPDRGLAAAPADAEEGRRYYAAMACAANYAFANRQAITHLLREAFAEVLGGGQLGLEVVYDLAHNVAKWEDREGEKVLVHRKGATRALPAGHPANPRDYRATGHPVLVPGSMGTASYVLAGTPQAAEAFYSANHGAGRVLSRAEARRRLRPGEVAESLGGVVVEGNLRDMLDEAPAAYKDIDLVVKTVVDAGLLKPVARLKPLAVLKGPDD